MKARILTLICAATVTLAPISFGRADTASDGFAMIADTLILRPACLAGTIIGSAFFVVSLPIAAITGSVKETAHTLVVVPAQATFRRPLGDFDMLTDY